MFVKNTSLHHSYHYFDCCVNSAKFEYQINVVVDKTEKKTLNWECDRRGIPCIYKN